MTATPALEELLYRPATLRDVAAMAQLRSGQWGNAPDWEHTIASYLSGEHHPRHALFTRVVIIAERDGEVVGFIAGHLSRRYQCHGELQWLNVSAQEENAYDIATELLRQLADWFVQNSATRICVDARPGNEAAKNFYMALGAEPLNAHWMIFPDISRTLQPA